ncbi:hypothetical protein TWF173_010120 [Orbilia oligospora]|nr:hypothetical protein TWF173_010120 [Orbilia oligospora]
MSSAPASAHLLKRQLKEMQNNKDIPGISCGLHKDNIYDWEVMLMVSDDVKYYGGTTVPIRVVRPDRKSGIESSLKGSKMLITSRLGGFFKARLIFPKEYPLMPPEMKFESPIWHPNIYPEGKVCISILHPPEEDKYGYESAAERWLPVHTPETILVSVLSMLSSPNDESPANLDAAKMWRENLPEFKKKVRKCVRDSLEDAF